MMKSKKVTEKFDKDAARKVAHNLTEDKDHMVVRLGTILEQMGRVRTANGIMELKKEFMLELLESIPLDVDSCYFCICGTSYQNCSKCSYAKTHGVCGEKGAAFTKIEEAVLELHDLIDETYW